MIEAAVEDRTFSGNPANTLSVYMRREFGKRGWLWPPSSLAWKQFFLRHFVDVLF